MTLGWNHSRTWASCCYRLHSHQERVAQETRQRSSTQKRL